MPDSSTFIYSPWPSDIILCTKVQSILSTASCLMAVSTLPDDHHSKFENAIFLPNFKVNGNFVFKVKHSSSIKSCLLDYI